MKKFLIFLVSLIVVVCVGLTTYYFMRNNEIITIKTKEIYCNVGDSIPLSSLGINIKKANISKKTTFNYNAGGDAVTKFIKYDENSNAYIVSQENAGEITLVISTSNKKYADFTITVHIGNGSIENPYYIFNETELMRIGSTYRLDKHYILMNDITLTSNFKPIGFNSNTSTWESFNGSFNGNGYSIKGLEVKDSDAQNVGFFASLGANASVSNLTIENANITGSYANAGALAGVVDGKIEKVVVRNATITNTSSNSTVGAVVGKLNGDMKVSYAENVKLNVNGTEEAKIENVIVGGLVGEINKSTIQACYTNNVEIAFTNAQATVGGFAGKFEIGTETGSIQQSYANTVCADANFGAFVGEVTMSEDFNAEKANTLRHFIGNIAIVNVVNNSSSIADTQLVKKFDKTFFKNATYVDRSAFFDKESALYLVRGFASASEMISTDEFVYYAIDMNNVTTWDTAYVWNTSKNALPSLRMGSIYPEAPSGEYFRRNLTQKHMGNKETFVDTFSSTVENESIKLLSDVDLSAGWTPVAVKNTTIDGDNKTITINLNNAVDGKLGLFTTVDNVTIKNLTIVVTGVSAKSTEAGALAGVITSSDNIATSTIENVKVVYQNFENPEITNFGGIAGTIENTVIANCEVFGLNINSDSQVQTAGGVVAIVNANATVKDVKVNATLYANTNVGGVVGTNAGVVTGVTGDVTVNFNKTTSIAYVGGVVANNSGVVNTIDLTINSNIANAGETIYVAGVVAENSGTIGNVTVAGDAISLAEINTKAYVGGVVAINNGTVSSINNKIAKVGSYYVGKNYFVGGVVAINNGTILEVLTQSDLEGNYVSGVVAQMNNTAASIDQVAVGKYDAENKTLAQNVIKGDKYLAGVVVDFKAGTITNVQSASKLVGETNETRSSLVALIFAYGSSLKSSTINSSFEGYGIRYREVWTDFASFSNKAEFGLETGGTYDGRFNLYFQDVHHGSMQSVVINGDNEGVADATASLGNAFAFTSDYQNTAESSFVKVVGGFNDMSQFQGSFEFVCGKSAWFGIEHKATKELSFGIGSIWESNNGISLMFLNNIA